MKIFTEKTTKKFIHAFLSLAMLSASGCGTGANQQVFPVSEAPRSESTSQPISDSVSGFVSESDRKPADTETDLVKPSDTATAKPTEVESGKSERELEVREFEPVKFEPSVAEYEVLPDLSNIKNISDFSFLTDAQRELLAKNQFVVTPSDNRQIYYVYESNDYENIPGFITADSVLHTYHIFYNYALRTCEAKKFLPMLEQLTDEMIMLTLDAMTVSNDPIIRERFINILAYFCTAEMLLGNMPPQNMPDEAIEMANAEYNLIKTQNEKAISPLTGQQVQYSIFKPWGHYTHSEDLKRYFEVATLYGTLGLPFFDENGEFLTYQTIDSLIITSILFSSPEASRLWKDIYEASGFFVGDSGDITPERLNSILTGVYGNNPSPDNFSNAAKLDIMRLELSKLQFCFMGRRYIPDAEILGSLTEPVLRPLPKGLDVFAVMGSERAAGHLEKYHPSSVTWSGYSETFNSLREKFKSLPEKTWQSNMYYGWFWILKALTGDFGEGYPMFMKTEAWKDKSLMTALGSWTELRRDTLLHAKTETVAAGSGTGELIPQYVEPNVAAYERLLWLTKFCREDLLWRGILDDELRERMADFESLLSFLIDCSVKELTNEPFSDEDLSRLRGYGDEIKEIMLSCAAKPENRYTGAGRISESGVNMATIADVYSTSHAYLEEAIGYASEIYVVTPSEGELYLTRGAVFDYYEFESTTRLTDDDWRNILAAGGAPKRPKWTDSFIGE